VNMRLMLVLACLLGLSLGASLEKERKPHHCSKAWAYAPYEYDAIEERIRIYEVGTFQNQSFTYDVLLLFREGVMYEIDDQSFKCVKRAITGDFQPIEVPASATLLGSAVIGSSSGHGEGLLVNTWTGQAPDGGKYILTMTDFGCIPVSNVLQTEPFNWMIFSYINTVIGIADPDTLNPPPFCPGREVPSEGEPVDFFTFFTVA
uniref:Ependymin-like 1 n=1 Tax=Neogobius melanostomus TaxID=47308 RepID=A0A8C6WZQ6_9GOBI